MTETPKSIQRLAMPALLLDEARLARNLNRMATHVRRRGGGGSPDLSRYPVGTLLRILPNHACATGARHDRYHVVSGVSPVVQATWPRFSGW